MLESFSWLFEPLNVYAQCFNTNRDTAVVDFANCIRENVEVYRTKIPVLNGSNLDVVPDGHLVHLRGMVQDMLSAELFVDQHIISDIDCPTSFRFRDYVTAQNINMDDTKRVKFGERHSFYVVPVPGESPWVRQVRDDGKDYISFREQVGCKRNAVQDIPVIPKRAKEETVSDTTSMPLTEQSTTPLLTANENENPEVGILMRVYDNVQANLKVNEVIEVYGILEHARLGNAATQEDDLFDGKEFGLAPRVHAVLINRLKHNNPLVSSNTPDLSAANSEQFICARRRLISELKCIFDGDQIAAEYTLLHFIYSRLATDTPYPNTLPALNIICPIESDDNHAQSCSMPTDSNVTTAHVSLFQRLRLLLPQVVTQMITVDLTLDSLNSGPSLMPIRDAEKGVLNTGRLQFPDGTQVLVDETNMTAGQLQARGLLNLRALMLLATKQLVPYDFQVYTKEWETNARVLIVSAGPSIIKPVLAVPWQPSKEVMPPRSNPSDVEWNEMRKFLTIMSHLNDGYSIDHNLQEKINEDFVSWRRTKATYIEADEFAVMLCLLRLICLTHGQITATAEHWEMVCTLERERRLRLQTKK